MLYVLSISTTNYRPAYETGNAHGRKYHKNRYANTAAPLNYKLRVCPPQTLAGWNGTQTKNEQAGGAQTDRRTAAAPVTRP